MSPAPKGPHTYIAKITVSTIPSAHFLTPGNPREPDLAHGRDLSHVPLGISFGIASGRMLNLGYVERLANILILPQEAAMTGFQEKEGIRPLKTGLSCLGFGQRARGSLGRGLGDLKTSWRGLRPTPHNPYCLVLYHLPRRRSVVRSHRSCQR